jgi:hypothetical protein
LHPREPAEPQRRETAGVGHLKRFEPQFEPLDERLDADQLVGKRGPGPAQLLGEQQMLQVVFPEVGPLVDADGPQFFGRPPPLPQPPVRFVGIA